MGDDAMDDNLPANLAYEECEALMKSVEERLRPGPGKEFVFLIRSGLFTLLLVLFIVSM
jgi:hypothetical protein